MVDGVIQWHHLVAAFGLNLVWLGLATLLFAWQFHQARVRGALLQLACDPLVGVAVDERGEIPLGGEELWVLEVIGCG